MMEALRHSRNLLWKRTGHIPVSYTHLNVSHFKTDGEITVPLFRDKYMNKELWAGYSDKEKSFFLGYYIHLLTDVLWKEKMCIRDRSLQAPDFTGSGMAMRSL